MPEICHIHSTWAYLSDMDHISYRYTKKIIILLKVIETPPLQD